MRVLVVCMGNICRSPMAAGLLRLRKGDLEVRTAGLYTRHGLDVSPHAVTALGELGVDISDHRPQPLDEDLVDWADRIFPMERAHCHEIMRRFPESRNKIHWPHEDVADPYGEDLGAYRRARERIAEVLERALGEE